MRPLSNQLKRRRPSRAWAVTIVIASLASLALIASALSHQRTADRPVGEGELFLEHATFAAAQVTDTMHSGMQAAPAIRHVRNELTVEALAIVDESGTVVSSTSGTLVGQNLTNGLLQFGHFDRRFVAVAAAVDVAIEVDGVAEWNPGDVVYHALHPLEDGSSLLMMYDISQLLERRVLTQGIQTFTIQLLGIALFFVVVSASLAIGRSRAWRRHEQLELEAEFLRARSSDLEHHNAALDEALALSEETNRVRAEFVLMINHELRTPLTGVVTGAELLATNETSMTEDDRARLLNDMVTDGQRLQEMIGQMLAVARVENRGLNFELADVSASAVCREIESKHTRLRALPDHESNVAGIYMRTEASTLVQVAASLADNALTHGANDVWITSSLSLPFEPMHEVGKRPEHAVYLLICDDGPGIEHEFLPRAFQKFEKLSRSSGTGLGLYLVSVMIDALGASLSVCTGETGTTMAIGVPTVQVAEMAR